MSSPVRDDNDKHAMYAPPWVRDDPRGDDDNRRIQAEIAAAAERRRPSQGPGAPPKQEPRRALADEAAEGAHRSEQQFDLEDAIRDAWASSRLDPVRMPPPPEEGGLPWGTLSRLGGAVGFAAIVALFVTGVTPLPQVNISLSRDTRSAGAAEPPAVTPEPARPTAAAKVNVAAAPPPPAAPTPSVAWPTPAPPPPPQATVGVAVSPSVAASFAAARPEPARPSASGVPQSRVLEYMSRDEIEQLLKRGHDLLANGDIPGGRLLLMRAAEAGEPRASYALGSSYDGPVMGYLGIVGVPPDPVKARAWYMRAAEQGSQEAARRLERMANR